MLRFRLKCVRCLCTAFFFLSLALTFGCGLAGSNNSPLPNALPQDPNVVSLNPQNWDILYSSGVGPHPVSDPTEGAWAFDFPGDNNLAAVGHVNYVQTPFNATKTPQAVTITFKVESTNPQYEVFGDLLPATFRLFFEQKNDNLTSADGRWWTNIVYNLGSADNQVHVFTVSLTPGQWGNVYGVNGAKDSSGFTAALKNVGWFGLTFGGQWFAGHGAAVTSGSAKFVLINYEVN